MLLGHPDIPLPLRVVAAEPGYGSFLTFDLVGGGETGWHIWIYLCDWQIWKDGAEILNSDFESREDCARVTAMFVGRDLERSVVDGDLEALTLHFSGGLELFVSDANDLYGDGEDLLLIYRGKFLTAFRGGIGLDSSPDRREAGKDS